MRMTHAFAGALLTSTFTLAACSGGEEAVVEDVDGIAGLEISNPRMVLAPVSGNPAAVYFDADYSGDRLIAISAASVEGAQDAMIHQYASDTFDNKMIDAPPQALRKGKPVSFEPGALHVMAMGVSPDLKPGDTTEITLTVSGGDKHSFKADILAAGDER